MQELAPSISIPVKLGVQQRVLPVYRAPFFDMLASACDKGCCVFAGTARQAESIEGSSALQVAGYAAAHNVHLFSGKFYLCWQSALLHWLEQWQPEVLIVEANPRYLHTPAAVNWMHRRSRPVIGWGLGAPAAGLLPAPFKKGFLRQFDALITYSGQGASEYASAGFAADRIIVAPNAAAGRPAHAMPERPPVFGANGPIVLFVGRLQSRKRVDLLIQACAALPELLRPRLWIAGDGPVRSELEALARQVYPETEFFGSRFGPDLEALFRQADLFVLPGTGGLAIQQAMSFGLPVMAAEADGTQTDLVRPQNGWMLPPGSLDGLQACLTEALSDAVRLRRMGQASYRLVDEEMNLENMVQAFGRAVRLVTS